jgi:mycofactocin system FadH/OYE family oxidoreductase 1
VERLLSPLTLAGRSAPNRVLFGPHVTNLGDDDRRFTARHLAYYRRRAAGGCGVVVTEEAAVHASDWPYERSPLAERCGDGWTDIARAVQQHGGLALAAIGHTGGQGSSAYSQAPLLAPSRVPEVNAREVPKWMEADDIAAVVAGFGTAAKLVIDAGMDGVEVNAGQHSLVRQFMSGLTNHRGDEWGTDRLRFAREVLAAVRSSIGAERVLSLRLSCDEMAPWAGVTPEMAEAIAAELAPLVDLLVVVRGSIYTVSATSPDTHAEPGFNVGLCRRIRAAVGGTVPIVLQGSVVDPGQAEWAIADGVADAVEMTRAQIADADLVAKLCAGEPDRIRPCVRCNQWCQVRDARNPIVSCIGDPTSGHETEDPDWTVPARVPRDVTVVGAGPGGLEAARVAALRGHRVLVVERSERLGGAVRDAALAAGREPLAALVDWQEAECRRLGVTFEQGATATDGHVIATGSAPARSWPDAIDVVDALRGDLPGGTVVVLDPIGGPVGVSLAETLAAQVRQVHLVTQDNIAANELARTGDLAPANTRLAQLGVVIERRSIVREVTSTSVTLEDRFTGEQRTIECAAVVDAGFRLPDESIEEGPHRARVGDCVAPRTIGEAILEARRAALAL